MSLGRASRLLWRPLSSLRPSVAASGPRPVGRRVRRELSNVPVDERICGLTEEQIQARTRSRYDVFDGGINLRDSVGVSIETVSDNEMGCG